MRVSLLVTAAVAVLLAGFQSAQGIIHEVIQGVLHFTRIAEYLHPGAGEFLLGSHAHTAGDDMRHIILENLVDRGTASSPMYCGIRYNLRAGDFLFVFVDIREQEKPALAEVRADVALDTALILQYYSNPHYNEPHFLFDKSIVLFLAWFLRGFHFTKARFDILKLLFEKFGLVFEHR